MGLAVFVTRLLESSTAFRDLTGALDTVFLTLANAVGAVLEPLIPLVRAFGGLLESVIPIYQIMQGPFLWGLQMTVNGLAILIASVSAVVAGLAEFLVQLRNLAPGGDSPDFGKILESAGAAYNRTMLAAAGMTSESLYGLGESTDDLRRSTDGATEALDQFTERLLNVPSGYRVARAQYAAQQPMDVMPVRIYTWEGISGGN
jgi:hypothetical protein